MENAKTTNVAVYIDYENIHKTLLKNNENVLRIGFFEKLRVWCKEKNKRIVQTIVYCNFDNEDLYLSHHQSMLQNYGVDTVHTSNQGKNFADLKISIDVLTSMYSNSNIDEFIIVSNDKDMTPLLNAIRANKRNVSIITAGEEYNKTICEFADEHIDLHTICAKEVDHLIINEFEERFYNNLTERLQKFIAEYDNDTTQMYKHNEIEYCVKNYTNYLKLMSYEILNIIDRCYRDGKIIFYKYNFKGKSYIAVITDKIKQDLLDRNLITESDIFTYTDLANKVSDEYKKFSK